MLTRCLPKMPKLTKRIVDATRATKGEIFLWDDELPGFGLRVKASGAKSFLVQYRNANGRSRRLTLGRYGVLTVEEGRREAKLALANVLKGADPAETRKLERGAVTIEILCREYFDKAERGLVLTRRGDAKSPTTLYVDKGRIERHIIPLIGKRTVKDLTSADVRRFQQSVISGKSAADIKNEDAGQGHREGWPWHGQPDHGASRRHYELRGRGRATDPTIRSTASSGQKIEPANGASTMRAIVGWESAWPQPKLAAKAGNVFWQAEQRRSPAAGWMRLKGC